MTTFAKGQRVRLNLPYSQLHGLEARVVGWASFDWGRELRYPVEIDLGDGELPLRIPLPPSALVEIVTPLPAPGPAHFTTYTVVVPTATAERWEENLRRSGVLFVGSTPGLTNEALAAGAEPSSWDGILLTYREDGLPASAALSGATLMCERRILDDLLATLANAPELSMIQRVTELDGTVLYEHPEGTL